MGAVPQAAIPITTTTAHPLVETGSLNRAKLVIQPSPLAMRALVPRVAMMRILVPLTPYFPVAPVMRNVHIRISPAASTMTDVAHQVAMPTTTMTALLIAGMES